MNTAQLSLTDEQREYLTDLASRIDDEAKSASEYLTENEDEPNGTFDCLDNYIETANLRHEEQTQAKVLFAAARQVWGKGWQEEVRECCELRLVGITIVSWEVGSYTLGEREWQLSDELSEELSKLSADERALVRRKVRECFMPERDTDCIYLNHDYDRWVLILDPDALTERIADAAKD